MSRTGSLSVFFFFSKISRTYTHNPPEYELLDPANALVSHPPSPPWKKIVVAGPANRWAKCRLSSVEPHPWRENLRRLEYGRASYRLFKPCLYFVFCINVERDVGVSLLS